jgi:acetyl esterase/lipase
MEARVAHLILVMAAAIGALGLSMPASIRQTEPSATRGTTFTYKQVGDLALKADVYRLPGNDVRPAILWLHGGALIFSNRGSVKDHQLERYLRAGYVVVSVDYRLAPETKLPAIVEDVRDAYRWLRAEGHGLFRIDPDRVAVIGNSAGGYLALWSGTGVLPRPRVVVSFYGYGDISREWTTAPSPYYVGQDPISKDEAYAAVGHAALSESSTFPRVIFYNYCRQKGLWSKEVLGVEVTTARAELERFSPTLHVSPDFPPTLLLHGSKDRDVPIDESERMAAALEKQRIPHRLVRLSDYDHLFDVFPEGWPSDKPPGELKDPRVIAAFDVVLQFLKEHLSDR